MAHGSVVKFCQPKKKVGDVVPGVVISPCVGRWVGEITNGLIAAA